MKTKAGRPNVVTIGGGTGMPAILLGLKKQPVNITAIVTVGDDGGSTGVLRKKLHAVPMGDIRNSLAALAMVPEIDRQLFETRFDQKADFLSNHSIGNLLLAALERQEHGIVPAVKTMCQALKTRGTVLPVCDHICTLHAKFTDGSSQVGESEITYSDKDIKSLWTKDVNGKMPKAIPEAIKAVQKADLIVLGPGSLFTSVMPNLMIKNLHDAIIKSSAKVVYVCNVLTQKGETMHYTDADHVKAIDDQMGSKVVNYAIVNNAPVPKGYVDYQVHHEYSVQIKNDPDAFKALNCQAFEGNYLKLGHHNAYDDTDKVAKLLYKLASQK